MSEAEKRYLGDGVYAAKEYGGVTLRTWNGIETTNKIFLEPEVAIELERYLKSYLRGEPVE
jgi:hypothetical protein